VNITPQKETSPPPAIAGSQEVATVAQSSFKCDRPGAQRSSSQVFGISWLILTVLLPAQAAQWFQGDVVFIDQIIALLVVLAEISPIEPGTMETGRKMTTAAAWRASATAALPVPVPA
jgi:hypothetical protein